jgi:hypothetical protein
MIGNDLTAAAEAAGARYLSMVMTWRGLYAQALAGGDFATPRAAQSLKDQAYAVARSFLKTEEALLDEAFASIALRARRDALLDASAALGADSDAARTGELLSAFSHYALVEITVQIERDVAHMMQRLRSAALVSEAAARAQAISRNAAQMQYRLRHGDELRFYFKDRSNRKWPSQKFVRTVVRGTLLETYNQVVMASLSEQRIDRARIVHPDASSRWQGAEITLAPNVDLPTYEEVRDEVFHPNSEAVLARPEGV